MKEEYKLYRKKALEALREKDALLAEQAVMLQQQGVHQPPPSSSSAQAGGGLRRGSGGPGSAGVRSGTPTPGGMGGLLDVEGDPRMQYLKNLVMRYLSTDSNEVSTSGTRQAAGRSCKTDSHTASLSTCYIPRCLPACPSSCMAVTCWLAG